jgi:uncharacterized membrane protein
VTRPFYSILLPIPIVCFVGALATDLVYGSTALIPWLDFSNWLILAGLVTGAVTAIVLFLQFSGRRRLRDSAPARAHLMVFSAALVIELFNMFVHDRDGWTAVVPVGFALSVIGVVLVLIAGWLWRSLPVGATS